MTRLGPPLSRSDTEQTSTAGGDPPGSIIRLDLKTGAVSEWFAREVAQALYVPGSGFYWMSSIGGQLAGGCH